MRLNALSPFLVLTFLLLLTGCGGNTPPDIVPIVKALMAAAGLSSVRSKAGNAVMQYLEQRVRYLVSKNGGWATENGFPSLIARLNSEMGQLATLIDDRATVMLNGSDAVMPPHRDLQDAANRLKTDGASYIATQFQTNAKERKERIAQIVWRAGAVQPELWAGGDSTPLPSLQKVSLGEMLDRRLHAVEMLIFHDQGKLGAWSVASAASGWKDQQRTSMFQYPWVTLDDGSGFQSALTTAGLNVVGLAPDWTAGANEINYKLQVRLRPSAAGDWTWNQANYMLTLNAASQGATAFEHLIPMNPKTDAVFEDFFERNWMYCDIMLAALHLQGLRFSRLRRTQSDADFNTATAAGVTLRPLIPGVGPPSVNILMANGARWFEGVAIPHDELQVGDHLIFWNNQFVRFILGSAFGLENSFVTRIHGNGKTVMLAGHGMIETEERKFAETMAELMTQTYKKLATFISAKINPLPVLAVIVSSGRRFQVVNWAPFREVFGPLDDTVKLTADGAWWIRLKREILRDAGGPVPSMEESLAMIPKSVRVDLPRMTPPILPANDFQPDYQEAIYLPLSVPAGIAGGWTKYLANPKGPGEAVGLVDLLPDGEMVPGFFLKGNNQNSRIPVLRPKVQP